METTELQHWHLQVQPFSCIVLHVSTNHVELSIISDSFAQYLWPEPDACIDRVIGHLQEVTGFLISIGAFISSVPPTLHFCSSP